MFDYKHSRGNGSASRLARFLLLFPQRNYKPVAGGASKTFANLFGCEF
jgi:hypothetical protein